MRAKLSDQPKQSSDSPVIKTSDETCLESKEATGQEKNMAKVNEKSDNVRRRSDNRERDPRNSSRREARKDRDKRRGHRIAKRLGGRRSGGAQYGSDISRRGGHGLRQGQRKGSGSNVAPNVIRVLPHFPPGDGLLPLPGTPGVGLMTQLRAATMLNMANIHNNIKATVEMLTNPPPVPGEIVTKFEESLRQPSATYESQETRNKLGIGGQQPAKRQQSSPKGGKNLRPLMDLVVKASAPTPAPAPAPIPSQQKRSGSVPKWLQKTLEDANGNQFHQASAGDVVFPVETNEADQPATLSPRGRCIGLERAGSQSDMNSRPIPHSPIANSDFNMQVSVSKRKSPFQSEEKTHGGKIVVGTSPEGLPEPNQAREWKTYPRPLCASQLQTGECMTKHCQYWHLQRDELEEVHQRNEVESFLWGIHTVD